MRVHFVYSAVLLIALVLINSCGIIPGAGPFNHGVGNSAEVSVNLVKNGYGEADPLRYALVEATQLMVMSMDRVTSYYTHTKYDWLPLELPENITIDVGDTLDITIYEAKPGGLFIPGEAGVRAGNFVTLPAQVVDSTGYIIIPYVGPVNVAGLTPVEVSAQVVEKLKNRAIDPQVIITFGNRAGSEVSVIGEVNQARRYSLNFNGETILDAIARSGGPSTPGYSTYVTLQRQGVEKSILMDDLILDPKKNIYLRPNDIVYLYEEPKTYMVFGAAGNEGRHEFNRRHLMLSEAMAKAQGLNQFQADPSDVYLFRYIDKQILRQFVDEADISKLKKLKDTVPTIFRFNLRKPSGFFLTQNFSMQDEDVIFIPDSDATNIQKFLSILGPASATAINIKVLN